MLCLLSVPFATTPALPPSAASTPSSFTRAQEASLTTPKPRAAELKPPRPPPPHVSTAHSTSSRVISALLSLPPDQSLCLSHPSWSSQCWPFNKYLFVNWNGAWACWYLQRLAPCSVDRLSGSQRDSLPASSSPFGAAAPPQAFPSLGTAHLTAYSPSATFLWTVVWTVRPVSKWCPS